MVDEDARRTAQKLTIQFRDATITNFELEGAWPSSKKKDRGLLAIETLLWNFYDDSHEHRLDGPHALSEEGLRLLDRCVVFLGSYVEYRWPVDDLTRGHFVGNVFLAEAGNPSPFATLAEYLKGTKPAGVTEIAMFGEDAVWPFFDRSEFSNVRSG